MSDSIELQNFKAAALNELSNLLDEDACRVAVFGFLHPEGAYCPRCKKSFNGNARFMRGQDIRCVCGTRFTARTGSMIEGSHLQTRQILLLAALINIMEGCLTTALIASLVGVSVDTVRLWQKKFKAFSND